MCPADPRTLDQRRAKALAALTQNYRPACSCGQGDCPNQASNGETGRYTSGA
ncbi:DUF222 domain-containing protein [Mycobacterium uberis]|uniref:DUF222 domain-containing protein n=1 Tax=Mycobacterium uberis TaxID=2162698 RepID=UPI001FB33E70|nr:DUF222 domain-containing protein [Mycobacterium uberis]